MLPRLLLALVLCCTAAGLGAPAPAAQAQPAYLPPGAPLPVMQGQSFLAEIEANDTYTTATFLPSSGLSALGNIFPNADVDYYSFNGSAGDRVHAAVITSFSANATKNSLLEVLSTDGVTVLEADDDDGSFSAAASVVAGVSLPTTGLYYLRVTAGDGGTLRPYQLHFRRFSGSPLAEVEANNTTGTAQALPLTVLVSGTLATVVDTDYYAVTLPAPGTLYLSLDLNPTRPGADWNGRLGLGLFDGTVLVANDNGSSGTPDGEALALTVRTAGVYYILVDSNGLAQGNYQLAVGFSADSNCFTYTSTAGPQAIPSGPSVITSTITIPDQFVIADLDVNLTLTHTQMSDLDVLLVSPAGSRNALFTDIGSSTYPTMTLRLDDEAAMPLGLFSPVNNLIMQPEPDYRLSWFDGAPALGVWSLVLYDDSAFDGGVLSEWSLTACVPPEPPVCPAGSLPAVLMQADFETGPSGFTHSGANDEWELGLPTGAPISSCNSGSGCWDTDLDGLYNAFSNQDLFSPALSLAGYVGAAWVTWAQKYQLETATFDHASVDAVDADDNYLRLWEWRDGTMETSVGSPPVTVAESAGWGLHTGDLSAFLGRAIKLRFHLDSDEIEQFDGLAIDDVTVTACQTYQLYLPLTPK